MWVPLVLGLGLALALADGQAGLRAWWTLRSDVANARQRVAALDAEIRELRRQEQALRDDPFVIEAAIREDLELAREGEVVVRIPPASGRSSR